jgi:hypothetical protein
MPVNTGMARLLGVAAIRAKVEGINDRNCGGKNKFP